MTNIEMLNAVIDSVWQDVLDLTGIQQHETLRIERADTHDVVRDWTFRRLKRLCLLKEIEVVTRDCTGGDTIAFDDSADADHVLIIDIPDIGLRYQKIGRHRVLGERWLDRQAQCLVDVQYIGKIRSGSSCHTVQRKSQDRVSLKQVQYIEQGGAILGFPVRPDYSDFVSRMEPWIMLGTVTVVVYLFYIIRS
ncbi:hypothetical protein JW948_06240 [bacterium]|nr:hypothetical protein [bacterium]